MIRRRGIRDSKVQSISGRSLSTSAGLLLGVLFLASLPACAWEVDHYTFPPGELIDIGDVLTEHVYEGLKRGIDGVNARIEPLLQEIERLTVLIPKTRRQAEMNRRRIKQLQARILKHSSPDALVNRCFRHITGGWALCAEMGRWVRSEELKLKYHELIQGGMLLYFRPPRDKSIYPVWITLHRTPIYIPLSPLIKVYNVETGIDKIGHLFKQGMQYYVVYRKSLKQGKSELAAEQDAIRKVGILTEKTYFGLMGAGVYGNADLAVNYIGLQFWRNLTEALDIDGITYPPMLTVRKDGSCALHEYYEANRDELLSRFVSLHYNEIFNPSYYVMFPKQIKKLMARDGKAWSQRYTDISKEDYQGLIHQLSTWYGYDYGHSGNFEELSSMALGNLLDPGEGKSAQIATQGPKGDSVSHSDHKGGVDVIGNLLARVFSHLSPQ
jgi:hypothetical protein